MHIRSINTNHPETRVNAVVKKLKKIEMSGRGTHGDERKKIIAYLERGFDYATIGFTNDRA